MALPDLIEIVPLDKSVRAEVTVPGSKSITNRALLLAVLAEGETVLRGALWSEDTQVMVECLQEIGFMVNVEADPEEFCNRTITVYGKGGEVPRGGTVAQPMELFVGNAGTAARFLTAMVCLGGGVYRLHGVARMHERPQAALFSALRQLGYQVASPNDKLPVVVQSGNSPRGNPATAKRNCAVSIAESSQFASALLLCAEAGGWMIDVVGENADESPYVKMTTELIAAFPKRGGSFQIEPDASSGSYFWAAGSLLQWNFGDAGPVTVNSWPASDWQIDARFRDFRGQVISRKTDLGDSIMTAITLAPLEMERKPGGEVKRFTDLGRLRVQECERVAALRVELTRCGAQVTEDGDTLVVRAAGKPLHGAEIETYNDHRMAMCFAILGLKIPGIKIKNPACVKKTFPNFFQKLAAPPPHGLGVTIRDAATKQPLAADELFAD